MEVTVHQLKEAIRNETRGVEEMIAMAKDKYRIERDEKYLKRINALELFRESNEQVLNLNWDEVSQKDIQSYYYTLISHQNKFQTSNGV